MAEYVTRAGVRVTSDGDPARALALGWVAVEKKPAAKKQPVKKQAPVEDDE